MDNPRNTYTRRHDATPTSELAALAAIYRFLLFECHAKNEGGPETAPKDGTKIEEDSADGRIPQVPR